MKKKEESEKIILKSYHEKDDLGGGEIFWELSKGNTYLVEGKKIRKI